MTRSASHRPTRFQLSLLASAGLALGGCAASPERLPAEDGALATANARVSLAIDATNTCVGDYLRRYDSPTVTPGDVLDAALVECSPFFAAHRGAVLELATLQLGESRRDLERASEQAGQYSNSFKRIVRETGLAVLIERRTGLSSLRSDSNEEFSL